MPVITTLLASFGGEKTKLIINFVWFVFPIHRNQKKKMEKGDAERGTTELYPGMIEPPEIRWAFIRKVYAIVAMQILLTIAVASVVVFVKPIHKFLASGTPGLVLLIVVFILTLLRTLFLSRSFFLF